MVEEQTEPQGEPKPEATEAPAAGAPAEPAAPPPAAAPEQPAAPPAPPPAAEAPQPPAGDAPGLPQAEPEAEAKPDRKEAAPRDKHRPAKPLPPDTHFIWGTGRRKKAVARVRIRPGEGKILINKREVDDYFHEDKDRNSVLAPLEAAKMRRSWDVWVNVGGGGHTGQAGAVMLGLARALVKAMPEVESALRDQGLMTRDARIKERKKPGQPGARKRFQFSKR